MSIPTVSWAEFERDFRWKQGEHLAAMAPTGAGKTTLFKNLTKYRNYNLVFGTKIADKQYDALIRSGFRRVERMDEIRPWDNNVMLWPKFKTTIPEFATRQRDAFRDALDVVVKQKSWTLWVDEAKYLSQFLKLSMELTFCLEQLRSIDATVICGAQRPAWLPPSVLSNSSHVFIWKTTDVEDQKKLSDIGGVDTKLVRQEAMTLGEFEFLYIKTRGTQSKIVRSQVKER